MPVESARSSETSVPERRPSGKDRWAAAVATQKSREMERAGSIRGATNDDVKSRLAGLQQGHVKRMAAMFAKLLKDAVAKARAEDEAMRETDADAARAANC